MEPNTAPVILQATALRKSFAGTDAIDGVSVTLRAGEIVALLGANGAGKSTLLYLLAGMLMPNRGLIHVFGFDRWRFNFPIRRRTSYLAAEPWFGACPTPWDYLQFVAAAYELTRGQLAERGDRLAAQMNMLSHLTKPFDQLSLGMRKKTGLIAAFLPENDLYLLDEPLAGGIDPIAMEVLRGWIAEASQRGAGVMFSTQVLDQTEELAHRLMVLIGGRVQHDDTPEALIRRAGIDPSENRALHKAFGKLVDFANEPVEP